MAEGYRMVNALRNIEYLKAKNERLRTANKTMLEALRKIDTTRSPTTRDAIQDIRDTTDRLIAIARTAIAKAEGRAA